MERYLLVALGGAIGTVGRYWLSGVVAQVGKAAFAAATAASTSAAVPAGTEAITDSVGDLSGGAVIRWVVELEMPEQVFVGAWANGVPEVSWLRPSLAERGQ